MLYFDATQSLDHDHKVILVGVILKTFVFDFICVIFCVTASPPVPVTLVDMAPAAPASPLDLPLPTTELKSYCQESCTVDGCDLPLIKQGTVNCKKYYLNTIKKYFLWFRFFCCCLFCGIFMPLSEVLTRTEIRDVSSQT